jgi:hypothetical protein
MTFPLFFVFMKAMATELETWQEIKDAALAGLKKLMSAQEYSAGAGLSVRRAMAKDYMDTIKQADAKITELGGSSAAVGSGFDPANRVEFVSPT